MQFMDLYHVLAHNHTQKKELCEYSAILTTPLGQWPINYVIVVKRLTEPLWAQSYVGWLTAQQDSIVSTAIDLTSMNTFFRTSTMNEANFSARPSGF